MVARNKAFKRLFKEGGRLMNLRHLTDAPDNAFKGLKLYIEYRNNETIGYTKEPEYKRFYLLDGESFTETDILERLSQEIYLLMEAGATFNTLFWKATNGEEYEIVEME